MFIRRLALPLALLAAGALAFILYVELTVAQLPEHAATHFGGGGQANGWMTRTGHEKFMLGAGLGVPLFLILVFATVRALGGAGLNIPHRDYWLAPERRAATLDFVEVHGLWFALLMLALMAGLHHLVLVANTAAPPLLPARDFWLLMLAFFAGTGVWAFRLLRHFARRECPGNT